MLELIRPTSFIPVHGTRHHLQSHADLAKDCGVDKTLIIENGQTAVVSHTELERGERVKVGRVHIDRGRRLLEPQVLQDRAALGRNGFAQLFLVLDGNGVPRMPARLVTIGVPGFDHPDDGKNLAYESQAWLCRHRKGWTKKGLDLRRELEKFLGWRLEKLVGRRPHVRAELVEEPAT